MSEADYLDWASELPIGEIAALLAERDRLRDALEEDARGWAAVYRIAHGERSSYSKLEEIRSAAEFQGRAVRAALQEASE